MSAGEILKTKVIVVLTACTLAGCASVTQDIKLRTTMDWRADIGTVQKANQPIFDVRAYKEVIGSPQHKMIYGVYHRSSIKEGWPFKGTDYSAENGLFLGYEYTINPSK
jgi:hypothetical protein